MTEAPEKIRTNAAGNAIVTPHPVWDTDVEYIRADVAQAMVAAAYQDALLQVSEGDHPFNVIKAISERTPTQARAALDAMLVKAREDALREAGGFGRWMIR